MDPEIFLKGLRGAQFLVEVKREVLRRRIEPVKRGQQVQLSAVETVREPLEVLFKKTGNGIQLRPVLRRDLYPPVVTVKLGAFPRERPQKVGRLETRLDR